MRIGIAQLNSTVGDLAGNLALAIDAYEQLVGQGVDLVVYPELMLCGYPPRDLLLKENFGRDCLNSLQEFARATGPTPGLIGFPEKNEGDAGEPFFNAAAWCMKGSVTQTFRKRLLPTYDVFDEDRYFAPGNSTLMIEYKGKSIAVTICEGVWNLEKDLYPTDPLDEIASEKPDFLINLSASPWYSGKECLRIDLLAGVARKVDCPVVYVNSVGGNDELVFDGFSLSLNANGELITSSRSFAEAIEVHDLRDESVYKHKDVLPEENLRKALVLGLRDYAHKSGFSKGLIGLSGGIDSAVTAALATEALGAENVIGISLPSAISVITARTTRVIWRQNLGIAFNTLPIQKIVDAATDELKPLFGDRPTGVTEENLQARARALLLMAVSNKLGALLLTTGNKSELAVGYCTLYGDMCGGLAVISDVPRHRYSPSPAT